jgi:hypothetical protein
MFQLVGTIDFLWGGKGIGGVRFGYWVPVDRHAFQARDDKTECVCGMFVESRWIATGYALAMTTPGCANKGRKESFT